MALMYRGYIFANLAGTYTFTSGNIDDSAYFWVGPTATTGWTTANAGMFATYNNKVLSTTFIAQDAGTYIPYRVVYFNGGSGASNGGGASLGITVTDPNKNAVDLSAGSLYTVQYSCDTGSTWANPMGQEI